LSTSFFQKKNGANNTSSAFAKFSDQMSLEKHGFGFVSLKNSFSNYFYPKHLEKHQKHIDKHIHDLKNKNKIASKTKINPNQKIFMR
jgi:hypothetical protein